MNADTPAVGIGPQPGVDVSRPNIARVYDYLLGGKDNFAADRELARQILQIYPPMRERARENRDFLARAVSFMAAQGIRQFLDVGSGLPTAQNTHQIAQKEAPECRVVYADADPVVVNHAHALLCDEGVVAIQGDLAHPETILKHPGISPVLHPGEPTGLILAMVLHFFPAGTAREIAGAFAARLPPDSYAVISVGCGDEKTGKALTSAYSAAPLFNHSPEQVARCFDGLELVPPGLVDAKSWRPGWEAAPSGRRGRKSAQSGHRGGRILAGVARKPR